MILAFDPGGTTGVAMWDPIRQEFRSLEVPGGFTGLADRLRDPYLSPDPPSEVIVERFTVNAGTHKKDPTAFADTTSIIGAIRFWCHPYIPVTFQTPQQAKQFAPDPRLRQLGWYTPSPGGHANDAARHLVTYLAHHRDPYVLRKLTSA